MGGSISSQSHRREKVNLALLYALPEFFLIYREGVPGDLCGSIQTGRYRFLNARRQKVTDRGMSAQVGFCVGWIERHNNHQEIFHRKCISNFVIKEMSET